MVRATERRRRMCERERLRVGVSEAARVAHP